MTDLVDHEWAQSIYFPIPMAFHGVLRLTQYRQVRTSLCGTSEQIDCGHASAWDACVRTRRFCASSARTKKEGPAAFGLGSLKVCQEATLCPLACLSRAPAQGAVLRRWRLGPGFPSRNAPARVRRGAAFRTQILEKPFTAPAEVPSLGWCHPYPWPHPSHL